MKFQNGFESGELDKWCLGRIDDPAYQRGLAWLENFNLMRAGGINRRKGYRHIERILEIRAPEYRKLDREDTAEEYRAADAETAGKEEDLRRADTVFGTSSSLVKLIPLPYDGGRTYLVYILPQKYGVVCFNGFEMTGKAEHPWPLPASGFAGVFPYRNADPDAHFAITGTGEIATRADLAAGQILDIGGNAAIEPGKIRITGKNAEKTGKLKTAGPFDIEPDPELGRFGAGWPGYVTDSADNKGLRLCQGADSAGAASGYFDEIGAGTGLKAVCDIEARDGEAVLKFTVSEGGSGFAADRNKDTTALELNAEGVGKVIVSAAVGSGGSIQSIADYTVKNYPAEGTGNAAMRFNAPPPENGNYSDIYDFYDEKPAAPATLAVSAEKVSDSENELGPHYRIRFGVENPGRGFKGLCKGADGNSVAFLKIKFASDAGGQLCQRELRIVARLDGSGGIASVKEIPFWIDDGLAAYRAASGAPGAAGDCFGEIMSAAKFNLPYGFYEDGAPQRPDLAPPVKYIVSLAANSREPRCFWRGPSMENYGYGNQSENSRNAAFMNGLLGSGPVQVLQEFAGTWYGKTLGLAGAARLYYACQPHGDGCGCGRIHVQPPAVNTGFPLASRAQVYGGDKTQASFYEFDPTMAGCCPKAASGPSFSAQPGLQWFSEGRRITAPYAGTLQKYGSGYRCGDWWFLPPVAAKRGNNVPNHIMFSAFQETVSGTRMVTSAGAYKGSGAYVWVKGLYTRPDASHPSGQVRFAITADNAEAKNYLLRSVDGITLYLKAREDGNNTVCEIPVKARTGSGGMLVLDKQDGTPTDESAVEYMADAKLKTAPPAPGAAVSLANGKGNGAAAKCAVAAVKNAAGFITKWTVSLNIPAMPDGEPCSEGGFAAGEALKASWNADGANYSVSLESGKARAGEIFLVFGYAAVLESGGKFKTDPKGTAYYGTAGGRSYSISVKDSKIVREDSLKEDAVPGPGVFKVLSDEEFGGLPSYWEWDAAQGEFRSAAVPVYPETDKSVSGLQYTYTGAYLILCGYGITPFTLEVKTGTLDIGLGYLYAKTSVGAEVSAPKEFELAPENSARDEAIPLMFLTSAAVSPSCAAFINGRLWVAGLPDDPARVFVSRPNRDRKSRTFDFTTYNLYETATPELTPFQAANDMNSNLLGAVSDGVMGLAAEYAAKPVAGKKVSFGYGRAAVLATPYFTKGASVASVADGLALDTASIPLAGEYTAAAAARLRNKTAYAIGMCRLKVTLPGGFCAITADCDGFELSIATGTQYVGLTNSVGPQAGFARVPYTAWGNGTGRIGTIAGAAGAAATLCGGALIAMAAVGGTCAAILAAAAKVVDSVIQGFIDGIGLELTNGSNDSPGMDEYGAQYPTTGAIQLKCDYLIAKNRLYEPKQPFVLRRWKIEESEYSTPDCGFTFKAASDEPEDISFIADMRSVFLATGSSERIMPGTANGEQQSAQTGSFFGSERIQAAKAADALYFVRKGGQSVMKAAYAPNVPVPQITDAQMYNREILRGRKILGIKSAKTYPASVWCVTDGGYVAALTENGGQQAWSRVASGAGDIIDTGSVPVSGAAPMRVMAIRTENGIYIGAAAEEPGEKGDVFLDLWREYNNALLGSEYGPGAAVWDSVSETLVPANPPPEPGEGKYIGYPYESRFRTLPGNSARTLSPSRVAAARFRLLESHLPFIKGYPSGMVNRMVHPLWNGHLDGTRDGVVAVPVPGGIEQDAAYEVFTSVPAPLSVICMAEEEDA